MRDDNDRRDDDRVTASLAGLAVALLLVWIGLYLLQELHTIAKLEDCVAQGRFNCKRIETPRPR